LAHSFQLVLGDPGRPAAPDFYARIGSIEVEENADLPGAIQITLPIGATAGDLDLVGDERFAPYARIAVVVSVTGNPDACIFDGYVLSHKIHVERGTTGSTLRVWGQDTTCIMNLEDKTKEWAQSDESIASSIFGDYNITASSDNGSSTSTLNQENGPTLMQRGTDAQFLRDRARRNGRLFRVAGGTRAGELVGYFAKPKLDGTPVKTLKLHATGTAPANVDALEIEWDVARPTKVDAHVLVNTKDPVDGTATSSGLDALDSRTLADFVGTRRAMKTRLTATALDAGDLRARATSVLREASWFVRCEGETNLSRLDHVLRVGTVVRLDGVGSVHSGKYYVWSVRHTLDAQTHRMKFVLVRNAVGTRGAS
jgi:phage protein D